VEGLTWSHPLAALTQEKFKGLKDPRVIAGVLTLTVVILYYFFR
jgi:hypothetical protein